MQQARFASRITRLFQSTSREKSNHRQSPSPTKKIRISNPGYFKPNSLESFELNTSTSSLDPICEKNRKSTSTFNYLKDSKVEIGVFSHTQTLRQIIPKNRKKINPQYTMRYKPIQLSQKQHRGHIKKNSPMATLAQDYAELREQRQQERVKNFRDLVWADIRRRHEEIKKTLPFPQTSRVQNVIIQRDEKYQPNLKIRGDKNKLSEQTTAQKKYMRTSDYIGKLSSLYKN